MKINGEKANLAGYLLTSWLTESNLSAVSNSNLAEMKYQKA